MEVAYTVGVSNRFASLMAEEDDPGDQLISSSNSPDKIDKTAAKRKDGKSGAGGKQLNKDNREKGGQQQRKPAQDAGKRMSNHVYYAPGCISVLS